jgi:hypothetical protein
MIKFKFFLIVLIFIFGTQIFAQPKKDSLNSISNFSGSIGLTNNGFSIVPTFSLNSPAAIINLSFRRNKFSFEPDIRLIPDASKGGMLFWVRYKLLEKNKFKLRIGGHPAFSYVKKTLNEKGKESQITEMLRFAAIEIVPNYQINRHWGVGAMFLKGHGLQKHGPQNTNVLFLNTSITNIKIGKSLNFNFIPMVYFLKIDKTGGNYVSSTFSLGKNNTPFRLSYTFNKTINSDIPGNRDFMWNVMMSYNFSNNYRILK